LISPKIDRTKRKDHASKDCAVELPKRSEPHLHFKVQAKIDLFENKP
jgi:hypothetical protein